MSKLKNKQDEKVDFLLVFGDIVTLTLLTKKRGVIMLNVTSRRILAFITLPWNGATWRYLRCPANWINGRQLNLMELQVGFVFFDSGLRPMNLILFLLFSFFLKHKRNAFTSERRVTGEDGNMRKQNTQGPMVRSQSCGC